MWRFSTALGSGRRGAAAAVLWVAVMVGCEQKPDPLVIYTSGGRGFCPRSN